MRDVNEAVADIRDISQAMENARKNVTMGDVPPELLNLVADAIDIVAPTLGPRVPTEIAAMLLTIVAMNVYSDIRVLDKIIPSATSH